MQREFSPNLEVVIGRIEISENANIYEIVNELFKRLEKLEEENKFLKQQYRQAITGETEGEENEPNRNSSRGRSKRPAN